MASAADVNVPQFQTLAAVRVAAQNISSSQLQSLVAVNYHAKDVNATNLQTLIGFRRSAVDVNASNLQILAAVQGRPNNPKLRAWTFDLDGHQFYVLKLGTNAKTLVFDLTTGTWSWWATFQQSFWKATTGINWIDNGPQANAHGTNVVVGDDQFGILWMLNPLQGYDDYPDQDNRSAGNVIPFDRLATGQSITRGRQWMPVYQVYLTAPTGTPSWTGATCSLSYSDDIGNTFVNAGSISSISGNYNQEYAWRSLGSFGPPGRLFQIYDNGAFSRIDGLDITDGRNPTI